MNSTADINYIYPNYDIAHGGVKDGLIRIAKADMSPEMFVNGQWRKFGQLNGFLEYVKDAQTNQEDTIMDFGDYEIEN